MKYLTQCKICKSIIGLCKNNQLQGSGSILEFRLVRGDYTVHSNMHRTKVYENKQLIRIPLL